MLRVISDALSSAADARYVTLLGMVDLSAAFDCVLLRFFFGMYPAMGVALYRRGAMDNLAR